MESIPDIDSSIVTFLEDRHAARHHRHSHFAYRHQHIHFGNGINIQIPNVFESAKLFDKHVAKWLVCPCYGLLMLNKFLADLVCLDCGVSYHFAGLG